MIVDAEDVEFFEIAEVTTANGPAVYIDGLVFHSAYAVDHIEQSKTNGNVVLNVFMTHAKAELSGRFEIDVPLTEDVKRILFGPEKAQIWPIAADSDDPIHAS